VMLMRRPIQLETKAHLPDDSQRLTTNRMAVQGADASSASRRELVRGLGTIDTLSLVVGTIIGTGIFLKAAVMARDLGSPGLVLAAWVAAGLLSLAGALTYAELGVLLPRAGGEYQYLRTAYGDLTAFLYGWMRFTVAGSGAAASLATGFAIFFSALVAAGAPWIARDVSLGGATVHWQLGWPQAVAVGAIVLFSAVNALGVVFGGHVQTVLTVVKVSGILGIVGGVFAFSDGTSWTALESSLRTPGLTGASAFGVAMLAALWAYDGWNNMPMAAGEVKNPAHTIPRALVGGMIVVVTVYLSVNLAYFYALPITAIAGATAASPVATRAVQTFLGPLATQAVTLAIMISILGALNGAILTGARVPFAMARDGLFFARLGELSQRTHAPVASLLAQGAWASVLAMLGTFDQLTNYVIFSGWIFYALTTASVFVLRRRMPDAPRPYRTIGYPLTPIVFVLAAIWLLYNTLATPSSRAEAIVGLALIALGLPVYAWFRRRPSR
jgi:basic amino acid/polyamine antiporter, APA family